MGRCRVSAGARAVPWQPRALAHLGRKAQAGLDEPPRRVPQRQALGETWLGLCPCKGHCCALDTAHHVRCGRGYLGVGVTIGGAGCVGADFGVGAAAAAGVAAAFALAFALARWCLAEERLGVVRSDSARARDCANLRSVGSGSVILVKALSRLAHGLLQLRRSDAVVRR